MEKDVNIPWREALTYAIKLGELLQESNCRNEEVIQNVRDLQRKLLGRGKDEPV